MIGAPNTRGQKYWVGIVQLAPETFVSEGIADIFRNCNIDGQGSPYNKMIYTQINLTSTRLALIFI